jgi:hypothetical protein
LRELDAHLDEIAAAELRRMDAAVVSYMAGEVGHVVVISDHPNHCIALALSDGRRLTLGVVSGATRRQLPSLDPPRLWGRRAGRNVGMPLWCRRIDLL